MLCSRYMSISDEWETPEKQPFKDFVSVTHCHFNHTFREYPPGVVEGGGGVITNGHFLFVLPG